MTIFPLGRTPRLRFPTRAQLLETMKANPSVLIVAIICGTIVALATIFAMYQLAHEGHASEAIGTLTLALLTLVLSKVRQVHKATTDQSKTPDNS